MDLEALGVSSALLHALEMKSEKISQYC